MEKVPNNTFLKCILECSAWVLSSPVWACLNEPRYMNPPEFVSLVAALWLQQWSQAACGPRRRRGTAPIPPGPITYEDAHITAVCRRVCPHCVLQLGQDTSPSAPDRLITWNNTDFLLWKVSTTNFNGVEAPYVSRRALSSPGKSCRTVPPHHAVCVDGKYVTTCYNCAVESHCRGRVESAGLFFSKEKQRDLTFLLLFMSAFKVTTEGVLQCS